MSASSKDLLTCPRAHVGCVLAGRPGSCKSGRVGVEGFSPILLQRPLPLSPVTSHRLPVMGGIVSPKDV